MYILPHPKNLAVQAFMGLVTSTPHRSVVITSLRIFANCEPYTIHVYAIQWSEMCFVSEMHFVDSNVNYFILNYSDRIVRLQFLSVSVP